MALNADRLGTDETVVLHLRTHAKRLLWPAIVLILDAVALGLGLALSHRYAPPVARLWIDLVLGIVVLAVFLTFVLAPWIRWMTTTYTFTNRRIITQRGVFTKKGHDLPLARINDVSYEKSVLDRLFGCGTLILQTAAEDPVVLDDIPGIERVHTTMTDLLFGDAAVGAAPTSQQPGWRHDD